MQSEYSVYKCSDGCGSSLMVLTGGKQALTCCGKEMQPLSEQTADSANEKHVPVIRWAGNGYEVEVGSTAHPMLDKHYINWIELTVDGVRMLAELQPGTDPKAFFPCAEAKDPSSVEAREFCNIHDLWKGKLA